MDRTDMLNLLTAVYERGEISQDAVEAIMSEFDSTEGSFLPEHYAEVDYDDRDDSEAVDGMRFDDMNYLRYRER